VSGTSEKPKINKSLLPGENGNAEKPEHKPPNTPRSLVVILSGVIQPTVSVIKLKAPCCLKRGLGFVGLST